MTLLSVNVNKIALLRNSRGGAVPSEFVASVEQGCRDALESGHLGGYPVVDVKVRLIDGSAHETDSSERAFRIAGAMAANDGLETFVGDKPVQSHKE